MGLYRRKDSSIWWMSFVVNGKQYQKPTGTSDKKLAENILAKVTTRIVEDKWFEKDLSKEITLKEMIERYDREYTEMKDYYQKARDKTIFKHLYAFFGENVTLEEVNARVGSYQKWREKQVSKKGKSPDSGTIRKELSLLRRMFNVARKQWKWRIMNPVSDIELPKDSKERVRYLDMDEFKRLFVKLDAAEEPWLKPIVIVAIGTGLRQGNLINLLKTEVRLKDKMIVIDSEKMKNDDYFGNPLANVAFETLKDFIENDVTDCPYVFNDNGTKLYDRKVQRAFVRVIRTAEIQDFRFHDLRHCFGSYLRQNGVDLATIAALMNHKDQRMTQRYAHLNVESLRRPIRKLDSALLRFYDVKSQK
ncbi:MAG: site-specific integrase [Alphaproteobacteria bacterium]|uniref:Site-specific integrase n=1 Tax=Candidatus Nitrobium versatile TaxID=2884831 RepID=A0A953J9R1_9BACT|nr:site-specific integrase [Candidatus Nitrobium versatile]